MESYEEITNFTVCKIQSLVAQQKLQANQAAGLNATPLDEGQSKFKGLFGLPDEDSLVIHYTCKYVLLMIIIYILCILIICIILVIPKPNCLDREQCICR